MKYKVFVDTSVLVAASVYATGIECLSIELKHRFFDQSMDLVGLLKKHLAKRVGIVTTTVEEEAYLVLERAVRTELERRVTDRATLFQVLSVTVNSCENRLRNILSHLLREPISSVEASRWFIQVTYMYDELEQRAHNLPKPATLKTELVPRGFKGVAFDIYRTQDQITNMQLTNLLVRPIEESDKTILAQGFCCIIGRSFFTDL